MTRRAVPADDFRFRLRPSFTRHSHGRYSRVTRGRDNRTCHIQAQVIKLLHLPIAFVRPTVHFRKAGVRYAHSA
jgi:hypothetical protein